MSNRLAPRAEKPIAFSVPDRELPNNNAPKKNNSLLDSVDRKTGLDPNRKRRGSSAVCCMHCRFLDRRTSRIPMLSSAHKTIADAGLSQDVLRPGWIILNFFPDMAHINTDVVAVFGMGWPPYSL